MKDGGGFEKLWKNEAFTSRLISFVWDEAHCISTWSHFREEYKDAYRLRYLLPKVPFYLASATFNDEVKQDVFKTLQIQAKDCVTFQRSNDRPNVHLEVRRMRHPANSFRDLDFLIPPGWKPGDALPSFLVFFDRIEESIAAAKRLRSRLPPDLRDKIVWFNSRMTDPFRQTALDAYISGDIFGLYSTDSFGMVYTHH